VLQVEDTALEGVKIITPRLFEDERGFFMETFSTRSFSAAGLPTEFVQDNHSYSKKGVLRGLHYQYPQWQGKLVRVLAGEIFDVAVDIRQDSATLGHWVGITLSAENRKQLYLPAGFAHGFCVLGEAAHIAYKCTSLYKHEDDRCLIWNDQDIAVDWPLQQPLLSAKDAQGKSLSMLWSD